MSFKNYIQVAGIIDAQEAEMLLQNGIKYLGFPLRLPVNTEDLSEEKAKEIISMINPPNYSVIISYSKTAEEALELCNKLNSNIIQLHGSINIKEIKKIKSQNIKIIKSLVIKEDNEKELVDLIQEIEMDIDAFITDTFDPESGASGATGKVHDWNISKKFVEYSAKPVILAGGLNPDNVYDAILKVKPAGVDVHTGIEDQNGRKNKILVTKFLEEAKRAFKQLTVE